MTRHTGESPSLELLSLMDLVSHSIVTIFSHLSSTPHFKPLHSLLMLFLFFFKERKKRNNRPKMASLVLSTTSPNQDLILNPTAISTFKQSLSSYPVNTSKVICRRDPCVPCPRKVTLPETIHSLLEYLPCPTSICL